MDATIELYVHAKRLLLQQLRAEFTSAGQIVSDMEGRADNASKAKSRAAAEKERRIRNFLSSEAAYYRSEPTRWNAKYAGGDVSDGVWEELRQISVADLLVFARGGTRKTSIAARPSDIIDKYIPWWLCSRHHEMDEESKPYIKSLLIDYISGPTDGDVARK
jgi:hypothetical protein